MSLPHIVLIPGFWEGPAVYTTVAASLTEHGYAVTVIPLTSTGAPVSDHSPTFHDDVAQIRAVLSKIIEFGDDIVLVGHAEGAFLASHATEGLSKRVRSARSEPGGVLKFAFIAGAVFPVGHKHGKADFMSLKVCLSSLFD